MWTEHDAAPGPVNNTVFSPNCANSSFRLPAGFRSIIPDIHTLYDYDKGIS
jgi:hypothetical protein